MMKRIFPAVVFLLFLASCSSQILNVPINPYVDLNFPQYHIRRVAVLPFIIPDYLDYREGAEAVSIEVTNRFMAEMAQVGLYDLTDGETVKSAVKNHYANPRDWIFQGTRTEAVRIGREVSADAVVFGVIRKYFQGNLTDSEFELELNCIEVTGIITVWRVKEQLVGKGGKKYLNETPFSIPPSRLAEVAASDAANQVRKIHEVKGPIDVVAVSHRKAWGYGVLATGMTLTAASAYYYFQAEEAYQNYKSSVAPADVDRYQNQVKDNDLAWHILGTAGLAAVGGGLYLILTDHTVPVKTSSAPPAAGKFMVQPVLVEPGAPGLACVWRF